VKFRATAARSPTAASAFTPALTPGNGRNLVDWLGHGQSSAQVLAVARQLLALEQALRQVLPPALQPVCRAARLEGQRLTLVVPGAAQASRLRQLTPRMLDRLTAQGWQLAEILIKIQAQSFQDTAPPRPGKQAAPLDRTALQAFDALHGQLPAGVLSEAVARLLQHHR